MSRKWPFRIRQTHSSAAEQTQSPQRNALCCSRADAVCTAFERARSKTGRRRRSSERSQLSARRHSSAPRSTSSRPSVRGLARIGRRAFATQRKSAASEFSPDPFSVAGVKKQRTFAVRSPPQTMSAGACQVCKTELNRAKLEALGRPPGPPHSAWFVEPRGPCLLPLLNEKRRFRVLACQPEA